ncbi:clathrin interactor EPSIN 1 [Senna tora]|uniref:Clathrin interactor EPSIN 1 n=1 Tax=Senna tora TaxID=362788 RepID=A0A834WSM8_9FABA|nr:clathrin interactor EPSIN 1 [Senna tora]
MDFMKVFDQTVREIKREVNLKVLKVPEIEQKVLDATDDEPWGPHGSALAEIAQATKKVSECQMVMNVLWTRLSETGKDWRYVYKALSVIEYLVARGSERAVDDIIEHTFQISALSSFEYVEPSGKDMGINVRKKAENIVALLNNKDKIQEARNKAAATRDKYAKFVNTKYFGLSSTGISYKSGSASSSSDRYGGFGSNDSDKYRSSYRDKGNYEEGRDEKDFPKKSSHGVTSGYQGSDFKKGYLHSVSKSQNSKSSKVSNSSTNVKDYDNYNSVHSQTSSLPENNIEDDFDDFDPRGTSTTKASAGSSNQVDLFGQDLIGDLIDAPTSIPTENPATNNVSEVNLFADATFVTAGPHEKKEATSQPLNEVDLFTSRPAIPSSITSTVDLFSIPEPAVQPDSKSENSTLEKNDIDPFAAVPLNKFEGSDMFGEFNSHSDTVTSHPSKSPISDGNHNNMNGISSPESKIPPKKDPFQVKSGIWADSLSRGLIDLNISAPKKVSLVDVGIVGGLSEGSDEREKGLPPASYSMGRAMGSGSGLGRSGIAATSQPAGGNDIFSNFTSQQYQFGGLQK